MDVGIEAKSLIQVIAAGNQPPPGGDEPTDTNGPADFKSVQHLILEIATYLGDNFADEIQSICAALNIGAARDRNLNRQETWYFLLADLWKGALGEDGWAAVVRPIDELLVTFRSNRPLMMMRKDLKAWAEDRYRYRRRR